MVAMRFRPGGCVQFIVGRGVLLCCTVCMFFWALLVVPSAHGQVIEESGFPVKGGGVSGESFSLFCPSRLYVAAGESVSFACTATAVPEEGVRYAWEAVSGDGLRLLSDAQAPDPLFTAPLSEAAEEYRYRLTGTGAGVYATATVTVEVVSGETVGAPVVREKCDPFTIPDELGEGCVEDKGPAPFGFGSEAEGGFLFPEAPGLPDRPSGPVRGGGSVMQAPPRLECPVAIFLEELETGSIECRVFDASGEEHLEYSWEPAGNTTRDYLENPRLIPEDSPTPSVVAPEVPAYETLESFRLGETTFRYRYRLTATSRASGLSSMAEVEVFVSGSRPGVYCPPEVAVEEGETIALDCEGVDPLSGRMDYDEDGASIEWEWEGLWGASTVLLDATDRSSSLFTAPAGTAGEAYHYIASMTSSASGLPRTARRRVTVRVTGAEEGTQAAADASAPANKGRVPVVTCNDAEAYETGANFTLDCSVTNEPPDARYVWTGTYGIDRLSSTTILRPTFIVPHSTNTNVVYVYRVRLYSSGIYGVTGKVTIKVIDRPKVKCPLYTPLHDIKVDEGQGDFSLSYCTRTWILYRDGKIDAYVHPPRIRFEWTARGNTTDTNLLHATNIEYPTFLVPDNVSGDTTFEYLLTVSADNDNATPHYAYANVTVRDTDPHVRCQDRYTVYEGSADITLDCSVAREPEGATYSWTARGNTTDTSLLSSTTVLQPTFDVPDDVDRNTDYDYTVTLSAVGVDDVAEVITVTVLNKEALSVVCTDVYEAYEGSGDIEFDCTASGAPAGSEYAYVWTVRGDTQDTSLLSSVDISSPMFYVPDEVASTTTHEYLLTVSSDNAEDAYAEITVTVLKRGSLSVACTDPDSVYEGSADVAFDCSATGAPSGSSYSYSWRARGATSGTSLLNRTDIASPVFYVPSSVTSDETYEYTLTASARNAESATAFVTVTVLKRGSLSVACTDPGSVYEGSADVAFDCSATGAPSGSSYSYSWRARGAMSGTSLLSRTDIASPVFYVPSSVTSDETYEYTLTVSARNAESATAFVTVTVLKRGSLSVACTDPGSVYEGSADVAFDCEASGAPSGSSYSYSWRARGATSGTSLLNRTDIASPVFYVPSSVTSDETYEYTLTASARNAESATAFVTVTVLKRGSLSVACTDPGSVYEGSADVAFDCEASGAPGGSSYSYAWTARGDTLDTVLLSATDGPAPTFLVPDEVDSDETYEYALTASARNAESATAFVTVTVLNRGALALACADPGSVYEGSADITLDCSASGAPEGSDYSYAWTARGGTADTDLLSATDNPSPTFYVPDAVDVTTDYEYLLTVSAANAEDAAAFVTVTVLNRGPLSVVCADPPSVYEGSEDFALDCSILGDTGDADYTYEWTARGATPNTDELSATNISSPTFDVPDALDATTTYEYLLTARAANVEDATAEVTVTVLNRGTLAVVCADPVSVYEGSADIAFDCSASGAPAGSNYTYAWTARGDTQDTSLLSATDVASPTFYVPDEIESDEMYTYRLTVSTSAGNIDAGTFDLTVNVYNSNDLEVVCTDRTVYEGSPPFRLQCTASGGPPGVLHEWDWSPDTNLTGPRIRTPVFTVPTNVESDMTFTYTATVTAGSMLATGELTVTVLNRSVLSVACADPGSVYEGSENITFDCSASGAPGDNPQYTYAWTARGGTANTDLLIAGTDGPSPTFAVPDEVEEDETYEYTLTVSADNAEDASEEVAVTVLDRAVAPPSEPVSPPVDSPPVASSSAREPSDPSALGVTISASSLDFGVQSAQTQVSLDPMTDGISTYVSGPYHAGRMTLSPGGSEENLSEGEEMNLSIEIASSVLLKRADAIEAASIVLAPSWSLAESCEQLSSQTIGGLYTEVTLSEDACRLLRFGGELDLTDVPSGQYTGSMDLILRSGEREETHTVEVDVTVIPAQQVITIGPRGVRFSTSRELPAGLTEEQNLSIYPDVAFLTEEKPHGVFELSNPSLIPLEVSVSARFGYTEATENGREVVVEDASGSHLGDLSQVVDIHPGVLVLQPGEKGLVRYGVKEGALAAMVEKGYAAFFDMVSEPRQYVRSDQMPEEVSGDRTARVTMRVPGVYVPGEGASQLRATLLSISYVGSLSATFLVETQDHPFVGEVVAYDGDGRELGRRETLVYTRSRVRIPLDRMPEEGAVFLRFSPRGSGRVPEPASIQWDAPRRDIGAAEDKDRATIPETLARKP